ncbi:hypothetical protein B0A54_13946 [Friedmanniomyces endolithicus]|uniref:ATPase AAA-type core domain-containing protein n=1 Tax=Friedmanniomyces endolithicus TaxID=329885 RepID=A0A4U0UHQ4_9PEZI|nr:hypothetical protein B0A54_13946 [Friedmanniomyces endolithicus]
MDEPFTLVEERPHPGPHHLFTNVLDLTSGRTADHDLQYISALRSANPSLIVTASPAYNIPLRAFAAAGFASCELDTTTDSFASWRGFNPPALRQQRGTLAESVHFAKFHYVWRGEDFVLFTVGGMQYVLKERREGEGEYGPSGVTDELIQTVGDWLLSDQEVVWVFDGYWQRSKALYLEVMKATWDKVILDEAVKKDLTSVTNKFFSSKQIYEDLGVPWKRGLLFHGPPGNGKTISIKALMHTLLDRKDPIPTLYVRHAPNTYSIQAVFNRARALSPCMLILEDVETIVTPQTRSYFFNEMDGLENNDGIFVVASTNFLDRLDPGLSKRPSRFDRKYLFPLPNEHERTLYCEYWRHKLSHNAAIVFPAKLCPAMSRITPGFSFAFLQECFVATLLILARGEDDDAYAARGDGDDEGLEKYELWRVFRQQADILRKEVEGEEGQQQQQQQQQLMQGAGWGEEGGQGSTYAARGGEPTDKHTRVHREQWSANSDAGLPDLERLRVKDGVLPALQYPSVKSEYINSAAFDYRL